MLTRLDAWRPVVGASVCALPCDLEHRSRPCGLTPARSPNPAPLALPPTSLAPSLCRPRSTVHPPSIVTVHGLPRPPPSAVRHPHSFIRSPFVDGLPSPQQHRKPTLRCLPSAVCRPHSFIRSPFVDGLPSARLESPPSAVPSAAHPPSAVHRPHSFIRSPFVDGLPRPSAVRRPFIPAS
jgi:hypothetical protein